MHAVHWVAKVTHAEQGELQAAQLEPVKYCEPEQAMQVLLAET
jgi:hypothetical protein